MVYHLTIAVGGVIGLASLWLGVQALVRRWRGMPQGTDVLACVLCDGDGRCRCGLKRAAEIAESQGNDFGRSEEQA